jgi:DNA-binding winged helix-turn-helix (wHTH) protein/tetratricopeptide (TPR) repeat protein
MTYTFEDYEIDTVLFEVRRGGVRSNVEPQVFNLLVYLIQNRDRVVTREELLEKVWCDRFVSDATLSSCIRAVRKALGDSGSRQTVIQTVHGRGFRFTAGITEFDDLSPSRAVVSSAPLHESSVWTGTTISPVTRSAEIFGRDGDLLALNGAWHRATEGERQVVFVTGEAGIGKSALLEAFVAGVRGPAGVGWGNCLDLKGIAEPYMPVLAALGQLVRDDRDGSFLSCLRHCAPTWLHQLPWLTAEGTAGPGEVPTAERMIREILEALDAMSRTKPVLIVLDDLHWSDASTMDFLRAAAMRQEPARLMIAGSYRPASLDNGSRAVDSLQSELRIRGRCIRLALAPLHEEAIARCLHQRTGHEPHPDLVRMLAQRTDGNPLYLRSLVDYYLANVSSPGTGTSDHILLTSIPEDLAAVVLDQLQQMPDAARRLLELAAVAGMEPSLAAVTAASGEDAERVEERLEAMARQQVFLRDNGEERWPDGTVSISLRFVHTVHRDIIYDHITGSRRRRAHAAIARFLEAAFTDEGPGRVIEVAHHYTLGGEPLKAAWHLLAAARQALRRSGHQEAVDFAARGLLLLDGHPRNGVDPLLEIDLNLLLGSAAVATRGWADPEAERAFVRASELARQVQAFDQFSSALYGLATLHEFRGNYLTAQRLLAERATLPIVLSSPERQLETRELQACSCFHQGAFDEAIVHVDAGLAVYDEEKHRLVIAAYGEEPGVCLNDWRALALLFRGHVAEARKHIAESLRLARRPDRTFSLAYALMQAATFHQHLGEVVRTAQLAMEAQGLAETPGFLYRRAVAGVMIGWAHAVMHDPERGLAIIREGIERHGATGAAMDRPLYLALMARAETLCGRPERGLDVLEEALSLVGEPRPFFYESELYRLRAELTHEVGGSERRIRDDIDTALTIARRQHARLLELRTLTSASRLANSFQKKDAMEKLGQTLARFSNEDDGPDIEEAKQVLLMSSA